MIDPSVRRASDGDVPELIVLEAEARGELVGQRGGDRWLDEHPVRGAAWADVVAAHVVYVAVIDEVVVGYLDGRVEGEVATVDEVFVHPEARECGFGSALLDEFLTAGAVLGATLIDGFALPGDRETKNLYERAGIKARLITVSAELPRPPISS